MYNDLKQPVFILIVPEDAEIVPVSDWLIAGFGMCPACGEPGVEKPPDEPSEYHFFVCSRMECYTAYDEPQEFVSHTAWYEEEPTEV